jgi:hypothetical protein
LSQGRRGGEVLGRYSGFEAIEAHAYNMNPADKRTVWRIIFEHFDYIVTEWNKFQEGKNG